MTCRQCGRVWAGKRRVCPAICRSRHAEELRAKRGAISDYRLEARLQAMDKARRGRRWAA